MQAVTTYSKEETLKFAKEFAQKFKNKGAVIALMGDLGSGKTTFVQGFAQGLGINEKILSPTFVLMRQHQIPASKRLLFHIDLYRFEKLDDIQALGLEEVFANPGNLVLVEWAEKLGDKLPKDSIKITFKQLSKNSRIIVIAASA